MFNCTNLPYLLNNSTYAQIACEGVNTAGSFITTTADNLSSHMVRQYDSFKTFAASESSAEKTAGIISRVLPALAATRFFFATLPAVHGSIDSFTKGKVVQGLAYGILTVVGLSLTYDSLSQALDPVGHVKL